MKYLIRQIHRVCWDQTLNAIKDGIMFVEPTGNILFVNQAAERLWEKTAVEIQKTNITTLHPGLGGIIHNAFKNKTSILALIDLGHAQILFKIHAGASADEWGAEHALTLKQLVVLEMEDVTEYMHHSQTSLGPRHSNGDEIHNLIYRDHLTNALNRRYFDISMPDILNLATLQGMPASLLIVDIDHFKIINDTHGHQAGDAVLQMLVDAMKNNSRKDDLVYRLGGDEFALILVNTPQKIALERAEKMRKDITEKHLEGKKTGIPVTISAGIASFPEHAISLEQLYRHADIALYQAKAHGRNCIRVYNDTDQE